MSKATNEEVMNKRLEKLKSRKAPSMGMYEPVDIVKNETDSEDTLKSTSKPIEKEDSQPQKQQKIEEVPAKKNDKKAKKVKSAVKTDDTAPDALERLRQKTKKLRIEDTHTRKTYLVRNDLLERLEDMSKNAHGFKIEFINYAIETALNDLENTEIDEE